MSAIAFVLPLMLFDLFVVVVENVTQIPHRHNVIDLRLVLHLYERNDRSIFAPAHPHICHYFHRLPFAILVVHFLWQQFQIFRLDHLLAVIQIDITDISKHFRGFHKIFFLLNLLPINTIPFFSCFLKICG